MKTVLRISALVLLSSAALSVQAQDLRLFEPVESEPGEPAPAAPNPGLATPINSQPAYTLRSISRFGDEYRAVLLDRSGQITQVNWRAGESVPLPGMSGFAVVDATAGTVALQHPAGDPCVAAELSGVLCLDGNRSQLQLTMSAPLASNGAPPVGILPGPEQQANQGFFGAAPMGPTPPVNANGQQVFYNPFSGEPEVMAPISDEERAQRQQRQEARAARLRAFDQQQQTIQDGDIPEGMRRVRTPFGDTLMPIRE